MRSTVRIDDDLMTALKSEAARKNISITRALNRALRAGLQSLHRESAPAPPFEQRTVGLGRPLFDLSNALELSTSLEDEEVRREFTLRK